MFREIGYGVAFYVSAMMGTAPGVALLVPPVRSGTIESQNAEEIVAAVVGAIAGSVAWLSFKYTALTPPKSRDDEDAS